jgi:dethiobiotin synthetase
MDWPRSALLMPRPDRLVVVAGTATEVGKTFVGAALLGRLQADGMRVAARKPVQSFAPGDLRTDADVLAAVTGEEPTAVCPRHRWYETPMAPPMAAEALRRRSFTVDELRTELAWPDAVDVGLVETAGGVGSPIADDGDCASLASALRPDLVVLVADAGLGTINAVRLSARALSRLPVVVLLNRFDRADELHERNRRWLAGRDGHDVVTDAGALAERVRACGTRVGQQGPPA